MKITIDVEGIDQLGRELTKEVEQFFSLVASEFKTQVTARTPIRSGQARRGWQQRQFARQQIVENQVPYIERLENGYSKQAPNGFVKQAITATVNKTKRIIK